MLLINTEDKQIRMYWKLLKDEEIPDNALDQEYVDNLYSGLKYKTYSAIEAEHRKKVRQIKTGWVIFFIWLVVIPAIYAIFEYSSNLLALIALVYSLYKAVRKGLELTGKWPKSKRTKERDHEEQLKNHYYYHCKMNPKGFRKLMLENMDKMNENEIAEEAELLQGVVVRPVQVQPVQKLVNWHCLEMSTQIITSQCYGSYWL